MVYPTVIYPQMPLTDTSIRNAKPGTTQRKLTDEKGLYLLIHPNGSKYWRFKYRIGGREKLLALGYILIFLLPPA